MDKGPWGYLTNGWTIGGQTVAQSGQPYSVYDFSGSVASMYYGTSNYIGNPIVPLVPGVTPAQAAHPGANCAGFSTKICKLNSADFLPQFVAPGTNGVPACDAAVAISTNRCTGLPAGTLFEAHFRCAST